MSIDNQIDVLAELIDKVSYLDRELERIKAYDTPGSTFPVYYLRAPLTSTSWDGDAHSTTAKTVIDLSAVFTGVPDNIEAVFVRLYCRDSASSANNALWIILSPNNTAGSGPVTLRPSGLPNDYYAEAVCWVPCDINGDIYFQISASGASTFDVGIEVWGWQYKTK